MVSEYEPVTLRKHAEFCARAVLYISAFRFWTPRSLVQIHRVLTDKEILLHP